MNPTFKFSFSFSAFPQIKPLVLSFHGIAALNLLYEITATLLIPNLEMDGTSMEELISSPAELKVKSSVTRPKSQEAQPGSPAWSCRWRGEIFQLIATQRLEAYTVVDLVLRSPLAALDEQDQNNIHVNRNVIDMIVTSLKFGQIEADQFRVDADPFKYPFRDFVMQYEESLLSFIRRQLAREGLALYIDHSGSLEKAVIVDPSDSFPALLDGANELQLGWVGNSKAADKADFPAFFDMTRETRVPPKRLILRDYNWEDPNKPLQVDLTVSPLGRGTLHYYGENFSTEGEGERLASVIKEEALSSSDIVKIQTNIPGAMPGLTLEVKGHPSPSINDRYLVARSEFCGSQEDKISKELKYDFDSDIDYGFHNLVELRRLTSPYRPPRMESRPKVAGSITAWIDGETDRRDINLDERGRYKVILPLDVSGRRLGEASAWVRMAQPSVGKGYGQNFPLAHGTEVLLTFIDGNPDRPVISGAVADAQTKGLVSGSCQNLGGIGARGGGALIFDEVQSGDNLTLANGTSRAGLTITSDAPATTVIHSDYLNTLSAGAINLNASFSRSMAGQEYTVKASNRRLSEALSMIGLNKYFPDAILPYKSYEPAPNDILKRHQNAVNTFNFDVFRAVAAFADVDKLRADSFLRPHRNLVRISANGTESEGSFKAKNANAGPVIALLCAILDSVSKAEPSLDIVAEAKAAGLSPEDLVHQKYDALLAAKTKLEEMERLNEKSEQKFLEYSALIEKAEKQRMEKERDQDSREEPGEAWAEPMPSLEEIYKQFAIIDSNYRKLQYLVESKRKTVDALANEYQALQAATSKIRNAIEIDETPPDGHEKVARILAETLTFYLLKPAEEPKGLVVKNDDSYVNIKARHSAALSGYGPVILESAEASLTDMLELGVFDENVPIAPFEPELKAPETSPASPKDAIESAKAILLHSKLVRAMGDEISLKAQGGVLAESEGAIQLVAGLGPAASSQMRASDKAREALKPFYDKFIQISQPDETDESISRAHLELLKKAKEYLDIDRGLKMDPDFLKGILLKTNEKGMDIVARTSAPDSEIKLLQGLKPGEDPQAATQMSLAAGKALTQAGAETRLELDREASSAIVSAAANALLSIKLGEIILKANSSTKLELKGNQASIVAPAGVSLKQSDASSLQINPEGIAIKGQILQSSALFTRL